MTDFTKKVNANDSTKIRDMYREKAFDGMTFNDYFHYILLARWLIQKYCVHEWKNFYNHVLYVGLESAIASTLHCRPIRPKDLTLDFIAVHLEINTLLLHNDNEFQKMYAELPESTLKPQ